MPIEINNTPFEVDGTRFSMICASPVIVNGMIVRVFNTGSTTQTYTYTDTSLAETTVSVPASGSAGNPLYVLVASSSAADSFNSTTRIAAIRLLITGSSVGNAFTEELITTTGAGSWTKPDGVTEVIVECWGGGGSGGGSITNQTAGGGGAGGQYARRLLRYSSPITNINYTVASSAAGGTGNGAKGDDTTWGSNQVVAIGGQGGFSGDVAPNGSTASLDTSGGDVVYPGTDGGSGFFDSFGGALYTGNGGRGRGSVGGTSLIEYGGEETFTQIILVGAINGTAGTSYGGGGSGAAKFSGPARSGGNGAQGLIRLIYR